MEQTIHTPETSMTSKYDQIWRRVAPNLEPYPDLREPAVPAMAPLASGAAPRASQPPAGGDLEHLPGAEENPSLHGHHGAGGTGSDRRVHRGGAGRPADLSGIRPAGTGFRPGTMRDLANASGAALPGG